MIRSSKYLLPLIVGAREEWCPESRDIIKIVGATNADIGDIIHTALRGGYIIHKQFNRVVWRSAKIKESSLIFGAVPVEFKQFVPLQDLSGKTLAGLASATIGCVFGLLVGCCSRELRHMLVLPVVRILNKAL